jgi:hypothetical protein
MIHCIGDSHSAVFSGKEEMQPIWPQRSDDKTPFFKSYRIGPATAYQLENKIPVIDEIITLNVKLDSDYVLFCFGEVDIRAHLIKQAKIQNKTINEIVKECVDRYFSVLLHYKQKGVKVAAWGPIASWHDSKPYTGGPSFGSCFERNTATKEFNRYLEELCNINSIHFFSIYDSMVDSNGITKPEYLDNWIGSHIHLSQTAMPLIIKSFNEKNLI